MIGRRLASLSVAFGIYVGACGASEESTSSGVDAAAGDSAGGSGAAAGASGGRAGAGGASGGAVGSGGSGGSAGSGADGGLPATCGGAGSDCPGEACCFEADPPGGGKSCIPVGNACGNLACRAGRCSCVQDSCASGKTCVSTTVVPGVEGAPPQITDECVTAAPSCMLCPSDCTCDGPTDSIVRCTCYAP